MTYANAPRLPRLNRSIEATGERALTERERDRLGVRETPRGVEEAEAEGRVYRVEDPPAWCTTWFDLGSTDELVRQSLGPPTRSVGETWYYGRSEVTFEDEHVSRFVQAGELCVRHPDR